MEESYEILLKVNIEKDSIVDVEEKKTKIKELEKKIESLFKDNYIWKLKNISINNNTKKSIKNDRRIFEIEKNKITTVFSFFNEKNHNDKKQIYKVIWKDQEEDFRYHVEVSGDIDVAKLLYESIRVKDLILGNEVKFRSIDNLLVEYGKQKVSDFGTKICDLVLSQDNDKKIFSLENDPYVLGMKNEDIMTHFSLIINLSHREKNEKHVFSFNTTTKVSELKDFVYQIIREFYESVEKKDIFFIIKGQNITFNHLDHNKLINFFFEHSIFPEQNNTFKVQLTILESSDSKKIKTSEYQKIFEFNDDLMISKESNEIQNFHNYFNQNNLLNNLVFNKLQNTLTLIDNVKPIVYELIITYGDKTKTISLRHSDIIVFETKGCSSFVLMKHEILKYFSDFFKNDINFWTDNFITMNNFYFLNKRFQDETNQKIDNPTSKNDSNFINENSKKNQNSTINNEPNNNTYSNIGISVLRNQINLLSNFLITNRNHFLNIFLFIIKFTFLVIFLDFYISIKFWKSIVPYILIGVISYLFIFWGDKIAVLLDTFFSNSGFYDTSRLFFLNQIRVFFLRSFTSFLRFVNFFFYQLTAMSINCFVRFSVKKTKYYDYAMVNKNLMAFRTINIFLDFSKIFFLFWLTIFPTIHKKIEDEINLSRDTESNDLLIKLKMKCNYTQNLFDSYYKKFNKNYNLHDFIVFENIKFSVESFAKTNKNTSTTEFLTLDEKILTTFIDYYKILNGICDKIKKFT